MKREQLPTFPIPTVSSQVSPRSSTGLDRWAIEKLRHGAGPARVRFVLWDGFSTPSDCSPDTPSVVVHNRRALGRWLWDPDLNFGEAYMRGDIEVRGDLPAVLEDVYRSKASGPQPRRWWLQSTNDLETAKANVHHHYDLGNAFYRLWLDREMVYTCAFFPVPDATLEDAQIAKMGRVCWKLKLRRGERVVEAGCGWGSLAIYMAEHHGVTVQAFNVSAEQIDYARARAKEKGLESRVQFVQDDYRNVSGRFDAFVSVGMLEHVGLADFATLGDVIDRSLGSTGRGLLHFIGRDRPAPLNAWIRKRIFPGAYPPTLVEVFDRILQPRAFSVLDVENLRLHYARTLRHWFQRFEASKDEVARMFDDDFVRAWRLYLAGSAAAFSTGWMQLFQVTFARAGSNAIPWSRDAVSPHRDENDGHV